MPRQHEAVFCEGYAAISENEARVRGAALAVGVSREKFFFFFVRRITAAS